MPGKRSSTSSPTRRALFKDKDMSNASYEEIMGLTAGGGAAALGTRLVALREWLTKEAKCTIHPAICIVNGEATDGTKNAPVLLFGPPPELVKKNKAAEGKTGGTGEIRCGLIDTTPDQALYDRTQGCQVRTAREIRKDEVVMTIPRSAMITPDLIAASDAGRAVLACCKPHGALTGFWDAFESTEVCETRSFARVSGNRGPQLIVKLLQERKKAEAASKDVDRGSFQLADKNSVSTRAPVLAFLIHQRFSNGMNPCVASHGGLDQLANSSAVSSTPKSGLPPDAPTSFAPYVRTLPSSISVPLCWKREELALLSGCVPGADILQQATATTVQLVTEFVALVNAGLTQRFPDIFPPGLITWDRWVWAAAVFSSRKLPVARYLNEGETSAAVHVTSETSAIQSSPAVWDELGVLVPFLDMLNHEAEMSQVSFKQCVPGHSSVSNEDEETADDVETAALAPRVVLQKRVKKGSQVFTDYEETVNKNLISRYGFALVGNDADFVKIGFGLTDLVGNVAAPTDYEPPSTEDGHATTEGELENVGARKSAIVAQTDFVYDSLDAQIISSWWNEDRISLLKEQSVIPDKKVSQLTEGRKVAAEAYASGAYNSEFLVFAVIGTIPVSHLKRWQSRRSDAGTAEGLAVTKKHQEILRRYLQFFYSRKMEKLLQSLDVGLKNHFDNVQLWTKVSNGGLQYAIESDEPDDDSREGWQSFFDSHAYASTMEVENRYYALGADSCVLTLYDGYLRGLQASLDGVATQKSFEKSVLKQLKELGFVIFEDDMEIEEEPMANGQSKVEKVEQPSGSDKQPDRSKGKSGDKNDKPPQESPKTGSKGRRRNRKKGGGGGGGGGGGDRVPATKLHIGNLAYTTKPADLCDYFAALYGRENILECHIPTERETGRSRGFGFVTLPEMVAKKVLQSGRKHQIDNRLLKVAESNSAGSNRGGRGPGGGSQASSSDRCVTCGYRPRYCVCAAPELPRRDGAPHHYGGEGRPPPDYYDPYRDAMDHDYYGSRYRRDRGRRSRSRSRGDRDRGWERDYGRDYDRDYHDYSRSYSRGDDRDMDRNRRDRDRDRNRGRGRSRDRSRERSRSPGRRHSRSRGSSRDWEGRPKRALRYSMSRSPSRSSERQSRRQRKSGETGASDRVAGSKTRSPNRSMSPDASKGSTSGAGADRKREASRGRSGRRKKNKREGSRRQRSRSRSGGSRSLGE